MSRSLNPIDSYKNTIEHLADTINGNDLNNLDKYLDENVEKILLSEVVYKNLKGARDYYTKERTNNRTSQWKIVHISDPNEKEKTIEAKLTFNEKTYKTKYTFSSSGKIQRIDATLDQ